MATTSTTAPVIYQVSTDEVIISVSSSVSPSSIGIVSNTISGLGSDAFWWAYESTPLQMDGYSHQIVLNSATNPNYVSETMGLASFNDGILYYSAFQATSQFFSSSVAGDYLIAFHLDPQGMSEPANADGFYTLSEIVSSNYLNYAHSVQNALVPLSEAALGIAGILFGGTGLATESATLIAQGIASAGNKAVPSTAAQLQSLAVTVAQGGWNAYALANAPTPVGSGGTPSSSSNSNMLWIILAIVAAAILILFMVGSKKRK